jgi:hypothetical protein
MIEKEMPNSGTNPLNSSQSTIFGGFNLVAQRSAA